MKYNPKINEVTSRLPGFALTHPLQPEDTVQGNLYLMYTLQEWLKEIVGLAGVTLQPAAGAHGELTGVLIIQKYHADRGDTQRTRILIPDSAHGTNPATSAMSGFEVVHLPSDARGNVELEALKSLCDERLAGIMLTNPNTLGLFDENVTQVIELVHAAGGLVYGDGANLNALLGIVRPGDLGFDIMHLNLHKTFSTPHGGGGPGSGPSRFASAGRILKLDPGLPLSNLRRRTPALIWLRALTRSIGRVSSFNTFLNLSARIRASLCTAGDAFEYRQKIGLERHHCWRR